VDPEVVVRPVGAQDWKLVERLFGERGACGGCWCMSARLPRAKFEAGKGEKNRRALRRLLQADQAHAVMAFARDEPVGWCSFGPRRDFVRLDAAPSLRRERVPTTWAVVCFFIPTRWRGRGVGTKLLAAAGERAFALGASEIEAYPAVPTKGRLPGTFAWTGVPALFEGAGYVQLRRSGFKRPIYLLGATPTARLRERS
jgi:GNAT superfamily N-acetyltransferase